MRCRAAMLVPVLAAALLVVGGLPVRADGVATVTGKVVQKDVTENNGIGGVEVSVQGVEGAVTTTSTEEESLGEFTLEGVALGEVTLTARKDGFKDAEVVVTVTEDPTSVTIEMEPVPVEEPGEGEPEPEPDPEEPPTFSISGIVRIPGRDGGPVAEVQVKCTPQVEGGTESTVTTDEDGKYAFEGLPDGLYMLTVEKEGYVALTRAVKLKDEPREANFVLEPVPGTEEPEPEDQVGVLEVTVTEGAEPGTPVADVVVRARGVHGTTAEDGKVTLENVLAGKVTVFAYKKGYHPVTQVVEIPVDGTATQAIPVAIQLVPRDPAAPQTPGTAALTGVVTDAATGEPLVGAAVYLDGVDDEPEVTTDTDGAYLIENISAPATVQVLVVADGYRKVQKRVRLTAGEEATVNLALKARKPEDAGKPEKDLEKGDISGTGRLTVADIITVLQAALTGLSEALADVADVAPSHANGDVGDGKLDVKDVLRLLRELVGLEKVFP